MTNKERGIDDALTALLCNGSWTTLEGMAKKLHVTPKEVHQAFMRLNKRAGWSIRPRNHTPYWRDTGRMRIPHPMPRMNRGRAKGGRGTTMIGQNQTGYALSTMCEDQTKPPTRDNRAPWDTPTKNSVLQ